MALLYVLNTGVTVRAERAQRALKGDVRENDFDPPDL
jgi:hypothetical protein